MFGVEYNAEDVVGCSAGLLMFFPVAVLTSFAWGGIQLGPFLGIDTEGDGECLMSTGIFWGLSYCNNLCSGIGRSPIGAC
jgi:hypothetical protein